MKYVDVKIGIWARHFFSDNTDMKKVIDTIKKEGVDSAIDPDLGFTERDFIYETETNLSAYDVIEGPTIEVYNDDLIYSNDPEFNDNSKTK